MTRHSLDPRPDWPAKVEAIGLSYHSADDHPYWDESAAYELTANEVQRLEAAANTLHRLALEAAAAVVENGWWHRLGIPPAAVPAIERSWDRDDFSLYGRFDFAFDGHSDPKLLEYNADTPTALLEAAVAQWFWLQDTHPDADQFNSLHERLVQAWRRWSGHTVHFAGVRDHPEDEMTVLYLRDTAQQAGVVTRPVYIDDLGWDARRAKFVDLDLAPIERCFKLYPWEWLWAEEFASHLAQDAVLFVEPVWKMLLSNKALLPILWELFPGHPNLLPAFASPEPLGQTYVRKPRLGREGSNVTWVDAGQVVEATDGTYDTADCIYQAPALIPEFDGNHPVFGVWIVDHEAAGLGIREDRHRITGNLSRFVPHFFR